MPCKLCGGPKPRVPGRQYCDRCLETIRQERKPYSRSKPCKACGGPKPPVAGRRYCDRCLENLCPECRHAGGTHGAWCLWLQRARRVLREHYQGLMPSRRPRVGVVSRRDIERLYEAHREAGVRYARRLGADGVAEDIVHDAVLYLIERQDFLARPPTKGYLFAAIRHGVMAWARSSYVTRTLWADEAGLVDLEEREHALARGRPRPPLVTMGEEP